MLPNETPMLVWVKTAKMDTLSSGKEVEKPTRMKPMVVFPKPVISETLIELFMVTSLALPRTISEAIRMSTFPINPVPSNTPLHLLTALRDTAKKLSQRR